MLHPDLVPGLLTTFALGSCGSLSDRPVARGRQGDIWRLTTDRGDWAVKTCDVPQTEEGVADSTTFQERAVAAGVAAPPVVRTTTGRVLADLDGTPLRVYGWRDLEEPSVALDPAALGDLVARLHRVEHDTVSGLDAWYTDPVGEQAWWRLTDDLAAAGAPFAGELRALVPELVALEGLLGSAPVQLRTCHRDLWADNVRRTPSGGICVVDFENAGLADPGQEVALVLFEFCDGSPARARALVDAYRASGGPGRIEGAASFAMVVAQQGHIVEEGCRRWLAASTEPERADNEAWVREFLDRPMTRAGIDELLTAVT